MIARLSLAAAVISAFCLAAAAHPLGNFSINQYSRIEPATTYIKIRQILDIAEIPTVQESWKIDTDNNGEISREELDAYGAVIAKEYISSLELILDGRPLELRESDRLVGLVLGEAGLPTIRIEWDLLADIGSNVRTRRVSFKNLNFSDRVGWNEVVVSPVKGVSVYDSTAYGSPLTNELKAYPENLLTSPPAERSAEFSCTVGRAPEGVHLLQDRDGKLTAARENDRLAELIAVPEVTPAIALFGLALAFGLGAVHAMSPGHGKAVVGAYLVGSRGTPRHAAFLGLTVTMTHTLGVFALGIVTLFASSFILPETLMPFMRFVSGLLVFFIGATLFKSRLFSAFGWTHTIDHDNDCRSHSHTDEHEIHAHDGHTHSHQPPDTVTWKSLLALGISGGLLPCPSALVLMLSAISFGRVGYGLLLTLIFSLGLAATLTAVGLAFLYVGKLFSHSSLSENRIVRTLPVFSAFIIACLGAVICYNSLP